MSSSLLLLPADIFFYAFNMGMLSLSDLMSLARVCKPLNKKIHSDVSRLMGGPLALVPGNTLLEKMHQPGLCGLCYHVASGVLVPRGWSSTYGRNFPMCVPCFKCKCTSHFQDSYCTILGVDCDDNLPQCIKFGKGASLYLPKQVHEYYAAVLRMILNDGSIDYDDEYVKYFINHAKAIKSMTCDTVRQFIKSMEPLHFFQTRGSL